MSDEEALGDPSRPRYFHRELGLVVHIDGHSLWHRNRARGKLRRLVNEAGRGIDEIEYRAGMGPGLLRRMGPG